MAADLFGLKRMGRVMGIVLTADGVAEAVVPMAVATLRDRTGSYGPASPCSWPWPPWAPWLCRSSRLQVVPKRTELGRGRTYSTLRQQASPRGQQEGKAGGQGERRAQRAEERKQRGDTTAAEDPDIAASSPARSPFPGARTSRSPTCAQRRSGSGP